MTWWLLCLVCKSPKILEVFETFRIFIRYSQCTGQRLEGVEGSTHTALGFHVVFSKFPAVEFIFGYNQGLIFLGGYKFILVLVNLKPFQITHGVQFGSLRSADVDTFSSGNDGLNLTEVCDL